MADIYGSHFDFGGQSSRMYDLVFVNINTSRWTRLAGTSENVTIYNKSSNKAYAIGDDHTRSPVTLEAEITTENCRYLDSSEQRQIEKWLFGHKDYRKLYFDMADDPTAVTYEIVDGKLYRNYLNCRMLNPERIEGNGGICGYKFQILCDSNMFWQDAHTHNFSVNNGAPDVSTIVTIPVDTDFLEYIYPKVKITMGGSGGDVTIINNTDDSTRLTKLVGISPYATVIMKGELNYVSGQYYEKLATRNFIRLLDGENKLFVLGDVDSIEFEYSARRSM
jgi:phage-related protein